MRARVLAGALILATLVASEGLAAQGYVGRKCGFDHGDHDGTVGEAGDCVIANGSAGIGGSTTCYVDCDSGSDSNAGSFASQKKTIAACKAALGDGFKIIGVKGTCTDVNSLAVGGGTSGNYSVSPRGNETRTFQYPSTPWMVVGQDADADGCYPPFDDGSATATAAGCSGTPDVCVLNLSGFTKAFTNAAAKSHVEIAHCTTINGGTASSSNGWFQNDQVGTHHFYIHDLRIIDWLRGQPDTSYAGIVRLLGIKNFDYFALENVDVVDVGGGFLLGRGSFGGDPAQLSDFLRFKSISLRGRVGGGTPNLTDFWGATDKVEVIDCDFDMNPLATGLTKGGGLNFGSGAQKWDIVNNRFRDFDRGIIAQTVEFQGLLAQLGRPTSEINVIRNFFDNPHTNQLGNRAAFGVYFQEGGNVANTCSGSSGSGTLSCPTLGVNCNTLCTGSGAPKACCTGAGTGTCGTCALNPAVPYEIIKDALIANNVFIAGEKGYSACIYDATSHLGANGSEIGGSHRILNNACISPNIDTLSGTKGLLAIELIRTQGPQDFEVKNNIFASNDTSDLSISATSADISTWDADNNAYPTTAKFKWKTNSATTSLATWRTQSGGDASGKQCAPMWDETDSTTLPTSDGHLDSTDTCAKDAGVTVAAITIDIDGTARPQGSFYEIGPDEIAAAPRILTWKSQPYTVAENVTPKQVCVAVTGTSGASTVAYATSNGTATAGSDYTAASGTLTFPDGDASDQCFNVTIANDATSETNETINLTLSSPSNASISGTNPTTLTITDNDNAGIIAFSAVTANVGENAGTVNLTCSRTGGSAGVVSVAIDTAGLSATQGTAPCSSGEDFIGKTNDLTSCAWADGESGNKTLTITICPDQVVDAGETFNVAMSPGSGSGAIGANSAVTVTIVDANSDLLADWKNRAAFVGSAKNAAGGPALDDSNNGANLTDHNSVGRESTLLASHGGQSYDFDSASNEYFSCSDAVCPSLDIAGSATMIAIVRPEGSSDMIVGKKHDGGAGLKMRWDAANGRYQCQINATTISSANASGPVNTTRCVACRVQDGITNGAEVLINAVQSGTRATISGGVHANPADFTLSDEDAGFDMNGQIRQFSVWPEALDDSAIARICSGLVAGTNLTCDTSDATLYEQCSTNSECASGAICDTGSTAKDDPYCIEGSSAGCCMGRNSTEASGVDLPACNQGQAAILPTCTSAAAPACSGSCPAGQVCEGTSSCSCVTPPATTVPPFTLPLCGDADAPMCAGACPTALQLCAYAQSTGACRCVKKKKIQ